MGNDWVGIGGDQPCIHIHFFLRAGQRRRGGGQHWRVPGAILFYLAWVMSAFVTFLRDSTDGVARQRRRAARKVKRRLRAARMAVAPSVVERGIRRCVAVAPPMVGRERLRRRWIGRGTWRALRLARAFERSGIGNSKCGARSVPVRGTAPCGVSVNCRPTTATPQWTTRCCGDVLLWKLQGAHSRGGLQRRVGHAQGRRGHQPRACDQARVGDLEAGISPGVC
jgi:hypothetical protein